MTTLAYRSGVLATDSQITYGNVRYGQAEKLTKLPNGGLVAICGSLTQGTRLLRFLEENDGNINDEALKLCPDVTALYVYPNRDVFVLEGGKRGGVAPMQGEFFADGSGFVAALAAMKMGAGAVRAIEVAAELDIHTSLPVQYVALDKVKPARKRRAKK